MMATAEKCGWQGELQHDEPLARYTSWRAGGRADHFYRPLNKNDLVLFLRDLPEGEPTFWIGLGSNLLVRDGGIRGTVICTRGCLGELFLKKDGLLYVEAGVPCAHVARYCTEQGLSGAEFLAGIPGTMGGALAMNAGAFGGETWDAVESVDMVNNQGELIKRGREEFEVSYRHVDKEKDEWFLSAEMRFSPGESKESRIRVRDLLAHRAKTQPTNLPSCGSVFRNPKDNHAARLIEQCGLKGLSIGGAEVSEKHANFIVNTGKASASDIEKLIRLVQKTVEEKQGVRLMPEVCIIGEAIRGGHV